MSRPNKPKTDGLKRGGSKKPRLTEKQKGFVMAYLATLKPGVAARMAGYKHPNTQGWHLMNYPQVKAAIDNAMAERAQRFRIEADQVVRELASIAFANMADYVDENGRPIKDIKDLPRDASAAISKFTIHPSEFGEKVTIELADKHSALVSLARHLGMFGERGAQRPDDATDAQGAARAKMTDLLRAHQPTPEPSKLH